MSVVCTVIIGAIDLSVGGLYDNAGSTWTWVLVLGITLLSAALAVILIFRDRKAYPKLYPEKATLRSLIRKKPEPVENGEDAGTSAETGAENDSGTDA